MITGMHAVLYTPDAEGARRFFRDVTQFDSVDAGGGWEIFRLPPAELAPHPASDADGVQLYLLCDSLPETVQELEARGATATTPPRDEGWGVVTTLAVPGGAEIGLYEPRHATPLDI